MYSSSLQNENFFSIIVGKKIRDFRIEKGISGAELGKMLNLSQQQVSRYERGINKITVDLLYEASLILDIKIESFLVIEQYDLNFHIPKVRKSEIDLL